MSRKRTWTRDGVKNMLTLILIRPQLKGLIESRIGLLGLRAIRFTKYLIDLNFGILHNPRHPKIIDHKQELRL